MTRRRHPRPSVAATVLVLVTALVAPLLGGPAAARQADDPLRPDVESVTAFVEPGGLFELTFSTVGIPADARVEVAVRDRVLSRSEFALSIDGERLRATRFSLPAAPLESFRETAELARVALRLGPGDGQVRLPQEGVYPVEVRILDAAGERIGGLITHLVALGEPGDDPRPLAVALVVEVGLPPALQPDGSRTVVSRDSGRIARVLEAVAANPDVPLSIAARPETVDALQRDEDANANAAIVALRDAVPGRQVIALPFADVDVAALVAAGMGDELDLQLERGRATLAEVLAVQPDPRVWLGGPTLDEAAVAALSDRGRAAFVVDEGRVDDVDEGLGLSLTRTFGLPLPGPPPEAAKADPVLSFRILDGADPDLAAQTVLAELAVLSLEQPAVDRGVVIRPPNGELPAVETLELVLDALAEPNELLTPVTLDQLFVQVEPIPGAEPALRPEPAADLGGFALELGKTRALLASFETMTGPLATRTAPIRALLNTASHRGLDGADRRAYLDAAQRAVAAELAAVTVSDARTVTLTARSGSIPLTLRNESGIPLNVRVRLDSPRLEFPDGDELDLTLTGEITRIDVAVRTRGSGSFPLRIEIASPDERIELAETSVTIRSTAVSGVGIVLSIGAIVVLALWWIRDWHNGRRDRRLVDRRTADRAQDDAWSPSDGAT